MPIERCVCVALLSLFALGCSGPTNAQNGATAQSSGASGTPTGPEPPFELLDLDAFGMPPDAKPPMMRSRTMLSYEAPGKALETYAKLKEKLAAAYWREQPGANLSAEYDSATGYFKRGDHTLSVSVSKASDPGMLYVSIQHNGNLDVSKLPLPKDAKEVYKFPHTAGYVTGGSVDETSKAFGDAMSAAGWSVFESSPGSTTYKRGTQTLHAYISSAPAQEGKTMMQLSPQLLPADLPLPPGADDVRFNHRPVELQFIYPGSWDEVAKFYQTELPRLGWSPTTENLIKNEHDAFQIYRNPEKALAELKVKTSGGKTLATVEYQSPTVFAEHEKAFEEYRKKQAEKGEKAEKE